MAKRTKSTTTPKLSAARNVSATPDELLLSALQEGGDTTKTGRSLVTFKEGAAEAGMKALRAQHGFRVASARDFAKQAVSFESTGDADALVFPEIGVAVVSGEGAASRAMRMGAATADSPVESVDPEYFMFASTVNPNDYLKGVLRAAQMIYADLGEREQELEGTDVMAEVAGATWGLVACKVPPSSKNGSGIKVAILDTGFDMGHPEFTGRSFVTNTFVGQPVADLNGHGTHTAGTACGPQAPAGPIQRYGIGFKTQIFVGKVLSNAGGGTQAGVLAGMNWALANQCAVISMSLGADIPPQPSYTQAGARALTAGCLIIAASGNASNRPAMIAQAGAPANSPTIVSVGAVDSAMRIANFSSGGKVDIAGPGVNVFSAWPRPRLHNTISGTSMATPHVAGCAALWAQTSASLRGPALRAKLIATAKHLPLPPTDVGAGLVQAP